MSANVAAAAPAPATDSAKKEARGRRFAKGPKKEGQGEPGKPRRAHPGGKTRSNKEAATLKFLARRIEQKAERELTEAQKKQIEELGGEAVILEKEVARKARAAERKEKEEAAAKANP
mmetsp:Transcript_35149/g.108918  ORF Transcript_35149/g.108918 Transcript_35149/m.108918 type:complete len:118 (+) Transcript_35149:223-576(+)